MLLRIRDFISSQGVASTQQLTREFKLDFSALKPMLDLWVTKGVIVQCQQPANCQSTCFKCKLHPTEYYQIA